jgi:hypothetical protein
MRSRWLALGSLLLPSLAYAHGLPPRALAPLLADDAGVQLVRLSSGLAQRRADGFAYVCPASWGADEAAPSAAYDAMWAAIATQRGLYWIGAEGSPQASELELGGLPVALADVASAVYVLVALEGSGWAVTRTTRASSAPVWRADRGQSAETSWLSLSADDEQILLAGTREGVLDQLLLAHDGSVVDQTSQPFTSPVLSIDAHLTSEGPYLAIATDDGQWTLARFAPSFHVLATAQASLVGPVASASGELLVAVDGVLFALRAGTLTALDTDAAVAALSQFRGESYASVRAGLCTIDRAGCGARVFDFSALHAPDLTLLAPDARGVCLAEWQHLQVDLSAAGLLPLERDAGIVQLDAGTKPTREPSDASLDAGRRSGTDAATKANQDAALASHRDSGCRLGVRSSSSASLLISSLLLGVLAARRGRGRRIV